MGMGAADVMGRVAASVGELAAVAPALDVPNAGLLCALPALLADRPGDRGALRGAQRDGDGFPAYESAPSAAIGLDVNSARSGHLTLVWSLPSC
jgi:hypothetical protein